MRYPDHIQKTLNGSEHGEERFSRFLKKKSPEYRAQTFFRMSYTALFTALMPT